MICRAFHPYHRINIVHVLVVSLFLSINLIRFCCVVVRERFPPERGEPLAGHTLTLVPALRLENLLPLELHYRTEHVTGTLAPAVTQPFHQVFTRLGYVFRHVS